MRHLISFALVAAVLGSAAGCKKKGEDQAAAKPAEGSAAAQKPDPAARPIDPAANAATAKDIVETAKAAGTFTTLLKAIDAAGLTATFAGAGPFTVFAPTDAAFAKLPPKDLEELLADKTKLEALLQYHVVSGALDSKALATQKSLKTVQGGDLAVDAATGIKIGGAVVVTPDVVASNGVIHAIDTVLQPVK